MSENQRTTNEATLASGGGTTMNIQNSTIYNMAGGNVNNPVQPAVATTNQESEFQTRMRIDNLEKEFDSHIKTKSSFKITGNFPTLLEPSSQFSPQMTRSKNYFGGGQREAISHEQFLQEITKGKSKRIALLGSAGFGKTVELKKLAQKLLENKHRNQDLSDEQPFKLILWIDLKSLQNEEMTLQELLFDDLDLSENDMEYLLNWIKHHQSNVVFLFDGLDQTWFDSGIKYREMRGLKKKGSVGCLLYNLLSRNFLPDVKIVISSREHSVTKLPEEARPDLVISLTGFTPDDAEQLFREVSSGEIDDQVIHNIRLLDMIKIPVYTIFTAVVHEFCNKDVPKYVSGLLAKILEIFTKSTHMREINIKNIDILHKMMRLSYEGCKDHRFTFEEEDLERHGLASVDASDMMKKIPKKNIHPGLLTERHIVLIFCHQTLQEFLAACYISKMKIDDFKSFTDNNVKYHRGNDKFNYWAVVIQYLCGITLNSLIEFDKDIQEVSDKNKKQEILRDALRERIREGIREDVARAAKCLVLHESNDDSLIRQLKRIYIGRSTPLNSNLARTISSLMRRNESMEAIALSSCGITDNLLQIIGENMKNSHLRVKEVRLWQPKWDVSFETLKSFFSSLEVDRLEMIAYPTDCREEFPIFQNVRTLKMKYGVTITNERHRVLFERKNFSGEFNKNEKFLKLHIKGGHLHLAVRAQNTCVADRVQVTAEGRCKAGLKDLHVMLDSKCEVDGQGMDLTVKVKLDDLELDTLVTGRSDIREASARWSVRSLEVMLEVESQEFLRKFKHEIGDYKICHLTLRGSGSYVFCDDDFNITSSIVAQCRVEHLEFYEIKNLKSEHLKSILQNCKLKILECGGRLLGWTTCEFNEIQEAAGLSGTELQGIVPKFDFPRLFSTSSTIIQLLHHLPTSSPDVHFPHHLAISSPVVRLPCDSPPTSSTNVDLVSEDDYERDYSTEANDDDSNANDEIPSKKRRAI